MVTGWLSNSKRQRRYFAPSTRIRQRPAKSGVAATKDSGNIRYFSKTGIMAGWFSGVKRYFATLSQAVGFKTTMLYAATTVL